MDERYFTHGSKNSKVLKRGRGSQKKKNVTVMTESTPLEDSEMGKKSSHFRFEKMKTLDNHTSSNVNEVLKNSIAIDSILITDKNTSYEDFKDLFNCHFSRKSDKAVTKTTLKWVHITIANAKRNLLDVYHMMQSIYLQGYLNEFCYSLNRSYFGEKLFDRLVIASIYANKTKKW